MHLNMIVIRDCPISALDLAKMVLLSVGFDGIRDARWSPLCMSPDGAWPEAALVPVFEM